MADATSENIQTVTIPIPLPFQRDFGIHARTEGKAERLMQRYNQAENKVITEQATRLGVTVSAFIRESAVNMAKALAQQEKDNAKHDIRSG